MDEVEGAGTTSSLSIARRPAFVGMVHVAALPGTPDHGRTGPTELVEIVDRAVEEATRLVEGGADGVLVENMHDRPYLRRRVGPEIVAAMTRVTAAVRKAIGPAVPLGVQVLAGANQAALAVASAAGADFIRAEGFVFAAVADEGLLDEADAGPLLRFRRRIGAERIAVLADIRKKHSSHAITADVDLAETARAAAFCGADGVVVTGTATGAPTDPDEVASVRAAAPDRLVAVGSGITPERTAALASAGADVLVVGSALKHDGRWNRSLDAARVAAMAEAVRAVDARSDAP